MAHIGLSGGSRDPQVGVVEALRERKLEDRPVGIASLGRVRDQRTVCACLGLR
jgi:hypothetical protein